MFYTENFVSDRIISGLHSSDMKRDLLSKANADMMTLETLLRNLMLTAVQPTSELEKRNVVGHISIILERHIKGKSNCEPMSVRTV